MFDAYIAHHARLRPDAPAILTADGAIGFARLDADVARAAALLRDLGAGADRPVALDIDDLHLNWLMILALARLGIPSAPGDDGACPLRIAARPDAAAALVIGAREIAAIMSGPVPAPARCDPAPDAIGRIMLSSGTTGTEKRIAHGWRAIDAGIRNVPIAYGTPPGPWLMTTGPHTILGFILTLGCWALGHPVVMAARAVDGALLRAMRPALVATTSVQLARLVDTLPAEAPRQAVRIVTGGGPVPPALLARTRAALTDDVVSVYGASECGAIAVATPSLLDRAPSAAGIVLPGVTVEIVDEHDVAAAAGTIGHVRVRGDRVAGGYLRGAPEAFRGGWFHPGDLGRLDAGGLLHLDGRADDLMNLGGQKVLPGWIETAARGAPGIIDVAAFSLTDADGWERCWLAIVTGDGFDERALGEALRAQLDAIERIAWFGIAALPRNAMGKIERPRLRALARATAAGSV